MKTSKSASNSPMATPKQLVSPSSHSVTNSPRIIRSNRYVQKILENEKVQEEARKLLMGGQQKLIIIPVGKSGGTNGKVCPQVKVCSTTNSSDSSEGKRTPPRHKRHHRQNGVAGHKSITKNYVWRPQAHQNLKVPQTYPSLRSLKTTNADEKTTSAALLPPSPSLGSFTCSDLPVTSLRPLSDVVSVRSLISIGMGSTDGKKLVIRRVPTSPSDLLNFTRTSP